MGFSYSKVDTHYNCPYRYKLAYVDKLEVLPDLKPSNALNLGKACHEGIETRSVDKAVENYKSNFPEISDDHLLEIERLKRAVSIAIDEIPEGEYERKLSHMGFIGFIDALVKVDDGVYDMYDFKYSNNTSYQDSAQLHIYKYYFELITGEKIRNMYYALIPKYDNKLNEDVETYFKDKHVTFLPIVYDYAKVEEFFGKKARMDADKKFLKNRTWKCRWCDYRRLCESCGKDTSELKNPIDFEKSNLKEISLF